MSARTLSGLALLLVVAGLVVWALRGCGDRATPGTAPRAAVAVTEDPAPPAPAPGAPQAPRSRARANVPDVAVPATPPAAAPVTPAAQVAATEFSEGPAAPGEIVGRVLLLPERTPISGAVLRRAFGSGSLATTGANGVFRVGALPAGLVRLEAVVEGRAPRLISVTVPKDGGVDGIEVLFGGGGAVEGRVATASGPAGGVQVRINRANVGGGKGLLGCRTGADGTFRFEDLPAGDYGVEVDAGDLGGRRSVVTVTAGETSRMDFAGGASVTGVLSDAGAPVAGAVVRATRIGGSPASAQSKCGQDGAFRIGSIEPGDWRIGVQTFGEGAFAVDVRDATLAPGENRIDVDLGRGEASGEIAGRVVAKEGGAALASRQVQISISALTEKADGVWDADRYVGQAFSGADGAFRFRGLRPGRYRIRVMPTGAPPLAGATADVPLAWGERRTGLDFALVPRAAPVQVPEASACALSGTVLDAEGRPVVRALVRASATDADRSRAASTDEAGRFRIEGLEPGAWSVMVSGSGPDVFSAEVAETTLSPGENSLAVRLDHGELAGEIRGRVFAASSGRALTTSDVVLSLYVLRDGVPVRYAGIAEIAADGRFRFRSVRGGSYRITAGPRAGSFRARDVDVVVATGEKVAAIDVALDDLATGKVVLVVRDAEARPVTDVVLEAVRDGAFQQGSFQQRSPNGVFETWLEVGTHAVTVRTPNGDLTATASIDVRAGETATVEIVLRPR